MTGKLVKPKILMNNSYLVKEFTQLKPLEFQTQHLNKTMYVQN